MLSHAKLALCAVLGLWIVTGALVVDAQVIKKPPPMQAVGTIQAMRPGVIQVKAAAGDLWLVKIPKTAEVYVKGTAEVDFLQPGMFIEFVAQLDRKGRAQGKIKKLTICTPSQERFPGIFPSQEGVGLLPEAGNAPKDPNAAAPYDVRAQITAIKHEKLTVNSGNAVINIELEEEPTVDVDIADYRFAKQGDKIECIGTMENERMKMGQAREVHIELSEPLAAPQKKKPRRPTASRPKKPADDPNKEPQPTEPPEEEPVRTWTDRTGQYKIEAALIEVKRGKVRLKTEEGKILSIPFNKLSKADQEYVRKQRAGKTR